MKLLNEPTPIREKKSKSPAAQEVGNRDTEVIAGPSSAPVADVEDDDEDEDEDEDDEDEEVYACLRCERWPYANSLGTW